MSVTSHHAEWLSLIEISGPFLSLPVLTRAFAQGLDTVDREVVARLQVAHDQWREPFEHGRPEPALHRAWVKYVLREALELTDAELAEGQDLPARLSVTAGQPRETLRPDFAVLDQADAKGRRRPRLLVWIQPPGQDLEKTVRGSAWKASPATRMAELLHGAGVPLGLLTNGEEWMIVHAPVGETTTYATFDASIWFEEQRLTLRAFTSLLSAHRFFNVAEAETLTGLLADSLKNQQEVTDRLGEQVRTAVEVLIRTIDRIDRERGRTLLAGFNEKRLYEAAVTLMMRLVFLFAAEERKLLPVENEVYQRHYAASTLRDVLEEQRSRDGDEVLERRYDAWSRLLATFRAVHGGVRHDRLTLPAYGGSLFDPDRFPFLEGRKPGTSWRETPARPLAVDNRTVLGLLDALQKLRVKVPGAGQADARRLSFRALDVEQIGHVYEGLLDHTAVRATTPVLGLQTAKGGAGEYPVADLERLREKGDDDLLDYLKKSTRRSKSALKNGLAAEPKPEDDERLLRACEQRGELYERVRPWAGLVREGTDGVPVVFDEGSVYVTEGEERRTTGTHYTPRSLTEEIVRHTLDPLVYEGPAEGKDEADWKLRTAGEILDLKICDMAMGSGAFLVQACRYLSARLVEAWERVEKEGAGDLLITPEGKPSRGDPGERPLPRDPDERLAIARRIVVGRCLYGVDKNPMAVEMAKLSLWLVTLQKDKPFTFLDHALRAGDSLLGVTDPAQIEGFHIETKRQLPFASLKTRGALERAEKLRRKLESFPVETIRDAEEKERLLTEANAALADARLIADLVIGAALSTATKSKTALNDLLEELEPEVQAAFGEREPDEPREDLKARLRERARRMLEEGRGEEHPERHTFHWPLEFPEVFERRGGRGFDAYVSNPPFRGGKLISGDLGSDYREHLIRRVGDGTRGNADLCAFFLLRAGALLREGGSVGTLATNTIAQGDTREVGLDTLTNSGFAIMRAEASRGWPGDANLEIAELWLQKGNWRGHHFLANRRVPGITAYLSRPGAAAGTPHRLAVNAGTAFIGSYVLGKGFLVSPEAARELIAHDPVNRDVLYPYLIGRDLNSRPDQSPSRWVVNFHDWPLDHDSAPEGYEGPVAEDYPDCLGLLVERVKPERERLAQKREASARGYARLWWQFGRRGDQLYAAIEGLPRVIVKSEVGNILSFASVPNGWVYSHMVVVFASHDGGLLAVLQSSLHMAWVHVHASSMRKDIRYTPTDCFSTFPLPYCLAGCRKEGVATERSRTAFMTDHGVGLTEMYTKLHSPQEAGPRLTTLRDHQVELDEAVAESYDWADLDLDHGFHETKQGIRFTISERARREVLDRLLELNHERYREEVARGLHEKKG